MSLIIPVIRWIFGIFFALSFLTYITQSPVTAIGSLLLAIMLIPPVAKFVFTKIPYTFPKKALAIFGAVLFFVTMSAVPKTDVKGVSTMATPTPTQNIIVTKIPTRKPTPTPTITPTPTTIPTVYIAPTDQPQQSTSTNTTGSTNSYYTNSDGNQVQSPSYSTDNSVPAGATAKCNDGTYSFSQHRSGTCSHHGGVAEWL